MTYYWVGDIPQSLVIDPIRHGEHVDLDTWAGIDVALITPSGEILQTVPLGDGDLGAGSLGGGGLTGVETDEGGLQFDWPFDNLLDEAGLWQVAVWLTAPGPRKERLEPIWIVVQDEDGWQTLDGAREDWPSAPSKDQRLWRLLEVAKLAVLAYAPVLPDTAAVPPSYREAQTMQARNVYNASTVNTSGGQGDDTFELRPFPLDWQVKQLLRPISRKVVG